MVLGELNGVPGIKPRLDENIASALPAGFLLQPQISVFPPVSSHVFLLLVLLIYKYIQDYSMIKNKNKESHTPFWVHYMPMPHSLIFLLLVVKLSEENSKPIGPSTLPCSSSSFVAANA